MGTLLSQYQNAKKLTPAKVKRDLFKFIRTLEGGLAQINKDTLNKKSEDVLGNAIGFYSRATEEITGGRKKEGDAFDLLETGDFLGGLTAKVQNNSILFDTKDSKKEEVLKNLLSSDIFGLQDDDLNDVLERFVEPFLQLYFIDNILK